MGTLLLYSLVSSFSKAFDTFFHTYINPPFNCMLIIFDQFPIVGDVDFLFFPYKHCLHDDPLNKSVLFPVLFESTEQIQYITVHTAKIKYMLMFYYNCFKSSTLLGTITLLFKEAVLICTHTSNYKHSHFPIALTAHCIFRLILPVCWVGVGIALLYFHFPEFQMFLGHLGFLLYE